MDVHNNFEQANLDTPRIVQRFVPGNHGHAETGSDFVDGFCLEGSYLTDTPDAGVGLLESQGRSEIGVVGAGNAARALSSYLSKQGHNVSLYARNREKLRYMIDSGKQTAVGKIEGTYPIKAVCRNAAELAQSCKTIFVATTVDAYEDVFANLAPHLHAGHEVILFSAKFAGSVHVDNILKSQGVYGVTVLETDSLFASRIQEDQSIWIRGIKGWTLFSGPQRSITEKYGGIIHRYFPTLDPASCVVQRGLTDFGAFAHSIIMLANMNAVDRKQQFLFYYEGMTETTVKLLEALEAEFGLIAGAFDTQIIPMKDLLNKYYGCNTKDLLTAMRSVPNYRYSTSPDTLNHRFFQEDVAYTLVPVSELAVKAKIDVPVINSVITIASTLTNHKFRETGRTLTKLGWQDLTFAQIVEQVYA